MPSGRAMAMRVSRSTAWARCGAGLSVPAISRSAVRSSGSSATAIWTRWCSGAGIVHRFPSARRAGGCGSLPAPRACAWSRARPPTPPKSSTVCCPSAAWRSSARSRRSSIGSSSDIP
jgi:hypothetical protein